jgi:hypothetical protein
MKAALAAALLALAAAAPPPAAEDFYAVRYSEGRQQLAVRDLERAAVSFRIAAFGSMAAPPTYEERLIWELLSEKRAGMNAEAASTLLEIAHVEKSFPGAYDSVVLPAAEKAEFEAVLLAGLPAETLLSSGRFARLVHAPEKPGKTKR